MRPRPPVTVLIARFEDLVARGLRALLDGDPNVCVVAENVAPADTDAALAALAPQVAILNFGSLAAPSDVHALHRRHPATSLVLLANRPSPVECAQLLAFGATACLAKDTQARDVVNAIHLASRGMQVLPRTGVPPAGDGPRSELLTLREADVLVLLQRGRSNAEIAQQLNVGVETVRTHARNIYRKLGVRTRRELAVPGAGAAPAPAERPPAR